MTRKGKSKEIQKMKLFVTGGAGFIGSNFIRYWLNEYPKDSIINLDALTYAGRKENLSDIEQNPQTKNRYEFIYGNITNASLVEELASESDAIVNFAAETHVDRSIHGNADIFVNTNILGTLILLDVARKRRIRFHQVSTDEVYGALQLNDGKSFSESTSLNPQSAYAQTKTAADLAVLASAQNVGVTITRCSNNYGAYQTAEKFIPRTITELLEGKKAKIYGDGLYVRDWLHVEDHCRAIDAVLHKGKLGSVYCVGGLTADISNLEITQMILETLGVSSEVDFDHPEKNPLIEIVPDRPNHDRRYAVDWSRIRNELGWKPQIELREGLRQTVNWYRENKTWWYDTKKTIEDFYAERRGEGKK